VKVVDLNVLLNVINEDAVRHHVALAWWESALSAEETIGLPWIVILGFLRLSTSPSVFPTPLPVETALARVHAWLARENVRLVSETDEHWSILRALLQEAGTGGNLTTDAHLAALAIASGAVLVSDDRDFARFEGLRFERPG
jgi:uncharacterized protein